MARIDENAPQGITVTFSDPYIPEVHDDDMGKNGVFALSLENNNGTFEISPNVAERHATFLISVRDNTLLDYEVRKTVRFKVNFKIIKFKLIFNNFLNIFRYLPKN